LQVLTCFYFNGDELTISFKNKIQLGHSVFIGPKADVFGL
jgi:hypothetical protein